MSPWSTTIFARRYCSPLMSTTAAAMSADSPFSDFCLLPMASSIRRAISTFLNRREVAADVVLGLFQARGHGWVDIDACGRDFFHAEILAGHQATEPEDEHAVLGHADGVQDPWRSMLLSRPSSQPARNLPCVPIKRPVVSCRSEKLCPTQGCVEDLTCDFMQIASI